MSWTRIGTLLTFPIALVHRTLRITVLTFIFVLSFLFCQAFLRGFGPRLLHWYFHASGGGFVKLGQVISMRYDLLPSAYTDELSKLLDNVAPAPTVKIIAAIEAEFCKPLRQCFADFEVVPLATASIAQVHGATLCDGHRVVVKVFRPGVERLFRIDLAYFRVLGHVLDRYGPFANISVRRVVEEIIQLTREEMDFRREARSIEEMQVRMRDGETDHCAPRIHPQLCGRSVITMERIDGVTVKEMIAAIEHSDEHRLGEWKEIGITPARTARLLLRSILEQTISYRQFHADPHAANIIVMRGGTLAWVDFGMTGWLDERLWAYQFKQRVAVASGRIHDAYLNLLATLEPLPPRDLSVFESQVKGYFRDWMIASGSHMATISERSSGFFFLRMFAAIRAAGLQMPLGLVRLYRTIIIGDIVMLKLDPLIDWVGVLREFIADEERRQLSVLCAESISSANAYAMAQAWVNAPVAAAEMTEWIRYRLPEASRMHPRQPSGFERLARLILRYMRTLVLFSIVTVAIGPLVAPHVFPNGEWDKLGVQLRPFWEFAAISGILLYLFLGRLIAELE